MGGFASLREGVKSTFQMIGQGGVSAAIYPNITNMALGWPFGLNCFFQHVDGKGM